MVPSKEQLLELCDPMSCDQLVSDFPSARRREDAFQANGIDISIAKVERFLNHGMLGKVTKELPDYEEVPANSLHGSWKLDAGEYLVTFNETVNLTGPYMAYLRPRSTLLRMGAALHTAVWDQGYVGKGQSLLVVYNPHGIEIYPNARIGQLVFHRLEQQPSEGYQGSYQGEGLETPALVYPDIDQLTAIHKLERESGCTLVSNQTKREMLSGDLPDPTASYYQMPDPIYTRWGPARQATLPGIAESLGFPPDKEVVAHNETGRLVKVNKGNGKLDYVFVPRTVVQEEL